MEKGWFILNKCYIEYLNFKVNQYLCFVCMIYWIIYVESRILWEKKIVVNWDYDWLYEL